MGRIIRNTRLMDTNYHDDIFTWMTEACADMRTKWTLRQVFMDRDVHFHKAEMPCGLVVLTAMEYKGLRLRQYNTAIHPGVADEQLETVTDAWISVVERTESPNGNPTYTQSSIAVPIIPCTEEWYQEDGPGYIALSFKEGRVAEGTGVRFHYKETPHDKQGFPLIPDNYDYKEALYWYSRMKMIESGWLDPVFDWDSCDQKYSIHSSRARAAIRYPSTNRAEEMADMMTLIPPPNYFANYGNIY
jgi:hypothetical protein